MGRLGKSEPERWIYEYLSAQYQQRPIALVFPSSVVTANHRRSLSDLDHRQFKHRQFKHWQFNEA